MVFNISKMFSLKPIDPEYSRSFAVVIQKTPVEGTTDEFTRRTVATVYHTEYFRNRRVDYNLEIVRFNNDMVPYCRNLKTLPLPKPSGDDVHTNFDEIVELTDIYSLKPNFEFEMACHNKVSKGYERFIKLVYGQSGSGKTVTLSKLIQRYRQAFPNNNIIYGSVNDVKNEPAFEDLVDENGASIIKELNLVKINHVIDVFKPEFRNALLMFDDLDANCGIFKPVDLDPALTPEVVQQLDFKKRRAVDKMVRDKMDAVSKDIKDTAISAVFNARKQNLSFCYIFHEFFANRFENQLLGEAKSVVLFPSGADQATLTRWLNKKLLLSKKSADFLTSRTWCKWDFLEIDKTTGRKFALMNDTLKLL
jgi:ABC-type dipeptide/oligopeptide/nickel transport system ATPase component